MNPCLLSSERMDWGTPRKFFDGLNAEFHFTLDACATTDNAKCPDFISPEQDALGQEWKGVVFMNPPYGRTIGLWVRKAWEEAQKGATVVCLIPSRTDTAWWHEYAMRGEIRFIRGRLKFEGAENSAPFPSAVVIFRGKGSR